MIYFDNSATSLIKPPEVADAVAYALRTFGNAGRSFYDAVMRANREIYKTRAEVAALIGLEDPLQVAFTSSATESLNLVIAGLINKDDSVITTVTEHNSVLRPLYLRGCALQFIDCDDAGVLQVDSFEELIQPSTRFLVCTHGSNVTGNVTDVEALHRICKAHAITMILDVSQTFGSIPVHKDMADIFCFTGHKSLFGPQGTGGVITNGTYDFKVVKTGGSGVHSFAPFQDTSMPDIFEVGTLNGQGMYGLQKGVQFINEVGISAIHEKEMRLLHGFYQGIRDIEGIEVYGDFSQEARLPVISINLPSLASSECAARLWEEYGIATRAGSHCAPLLHKRFDTIDRGMVRFSFSYFNTEEEIEEGVLAVKSIAQSGE